MKTTDFIAEGHIADDANSMQQDHEVQLARQDCYNAAKDAIELHHMLKKVSEEQGLEGWVSEKLTLAADYLRAVREHIEGNEMQMNAMPAFEFEAASAQLNTDLGDTPIAESASCGGTSAGSFATSATGGTGKPGTGIPKKVGNIIKRVAPKLGKGIYK